MSVMDSIDRSLEKAAQMQQKRLADESNRQQSLNSEISYLKQQMLHGNVDNGIEMMDEQSNYSPLRDDIKQIELQNELLGDSKFHQPNQEPSGDTDPDEEQMIEPIYQNKKTSKSKAAPKPSEKKKPRKAPQTQKQPCETLAKRHLLGQQLQKTQKEKPKSPPRPRKMKTVQYVTETEEKEKENGYVLPSDKYQNRDLHRKIQSIKQQVSEQLELKREEQGRKKPKQPFEPDIGFKIRGLRDEVELNYFGRVLPCKECDSLLNKGFSTDLCSQHGKASKETQRNKVVPRRFEKYY